MLRAVMGNCHHILYQCNDLIDLERNTLSFFLFFLLSVFLKWCYFSINFKCFIGLF